LDFMAGPRPPRGDSIEDALVEGQPGLSGPVCVHYVDLLVAIAGALERNLLPVGRPDGVVVGEITGVELGDPGPVRVHDEDVEVAIAVTGERNLPAVRRPDRIECLSSVRDLRHSGPVGIDDVDLEVSTNVAAEHDPRPVGRPDGTEVQSGVVRD